MIRLAALFVLYFAFVSCMIHAKSKADAIYVTIDRSRTVEISHDGKVLHVSATDTSGKTKCTVAPLNDDKGFSIICTE